MLSRERPLRFVGIVGKAPHIENVEVLEIPWSEESEIDLINTFDDSVMFERHGAEVTFAGFEYFEGFSVAVVRGIKRT